MRNFLASFFAFSASICCLSQQTPDLGIYPGNNFFTSPLEQAPPFTGTASAVNSFYINYDSADASLFGASRYKRYIWRMNNYYTASDSAMVRCVVAYDSLYDAYGSVGYNLSSISNIAIDSIFLRIGQENNTVVADTLSVKIIAVDSVRGYPLPNSVYWANILVIPPPGLSPDWRIPVTVKMAPYVSLYAKKFAIMVEYFGSKLDTLGIVAGFGYRQPCGSLAYPSDTTHFSPVRKLSAGDQFVANSFAVWSQYQFIGLLPTQNGSNIYFDCNNNGQYDGGTDGESYIQNIQVIAHVKTDAAAVNEYEGTVLMLEQNSPNPFDNATVINYQLSESRDVNIAVSDISGKKIITHRAGMQAPGRHFFTFDATTLEAGVYFYTLTAGTVSTTKKMVLIK